NRLLTKSYSDNNATKTVNYIWDTVRIGNLSSIRNTDSKTTFDSYDALGRVTKSTQTTPEAGPSYVFSNYSYYRDGRLKQVTYPSGRTISYGVDSAGRISSVGSYATGIVYAPHGGIRQMTLGSKLEQTCYNNRLQPVGVRLGSAVTS